MELSAIEQAFELFDGQTHGRWPSMRTRRHSVRRVPERDDLSEFRLAELVSRFNRGFARHHIEHLMECFFFARDEPLTLDAFEEFVEECAGIDIAREQEGWDAGDSDGFRAHRRGLDPDAFKEFVELVELIDDRAWDIYDNWREQALLFKSACVGDSGQECVEHHAFVEGVLVDDEDAMLVLGEEVAGVHLEYFDRVDDRGEKAFSSRRWSRRCREGWEIGTLEDLGELRSEFGLSVW